RGSLFASAGTGPEPATGARTYCPRGSSDLSRSAASGVRRRRLACGRHVPGAIAIEDLLGDLTLLTVLGVHREQDVSFAHLALVDLRLVLGNPVADERTGHAPDRRARGYTAQPA